MIVRGICCLIPGISDMSENIEVIIDVNVDHSPLDENTVFADLSVFNSAWDN